MSSIKLSPNASGTGEFTIAAPNSNTNRTLTLPDNTGTILTTATPGVPVNGPAFSAYNTSNQSFSVNTWTKTTLPTEEFDTANCFDSSTNYRFTPNVAGYYFINGSVNIAGTNAGTQRIIEIYKNGSVFKRGNQLAYSPSGATQVNVSALIYFNGSTDYVELYFFSSDSGALTNGGSTLLYFQGYMARAA